MEARRSGGGAGRRPLVLAVLLSGGGRTLENLLRAIDRGDLDATVAVVVSSRPGVRGLEIAGAAGIPTATVARGGHPSDVAFSDAVYAAVAPHEPDLLILAGFLRRLVVPPQWAGRILNIHPALLPESEAAGKGFHGERVHAAVLASGATRSGATVHIVDDGYDTGPVVLRATVPVLPGDTPDTLAARVFAAECTLYPEAIAEWRREMRDKI
ncbi:MAG: phosphoribosylglycinamide formyltransferase [Thermomicrobiales bacterium]